MSGTDQICKSHLYHKFNLNGDEPKDATSRGMKVKTQKENWQTRSPGPGLVNVLKVKTQKENWQTRSPGPPGPGLVNVLKVKTQNEN